MGGLVSDYPVSRGQRLRWIRRLCRGWQGGRRSLATRARIRIATTVGGTRQDNENRDCWGQEADLVLANQDAGIHGDVTLARFLHLDRVEVELTYGRDVFDHGGHAQQQFLD